MNRNEKNELKSRISEHINLANGRYKDSEVERLNSIVENRDAYNGHSRTYRNSYKTFDSEDTYRVEESTTYTFRTDDSGIRVEEDFTRDWDDGQHDVSHRTYSTGREILNIIGKVLRN